MIQISQNSKKEILDLSSLSKINEFPKKILCSDSKNYLQFSKQPLLTILSALKDNKTFFYNFYLSMKKEILIQSNNEIPLTFKNIIRDIAFIMCDPSDNSDLFYLNFISNIQNIFMVFFKRQL